MAECQSPALAGETYRDLVELATRQASTIDLCNKDKSALREWQDKHE